MTKIEEMIDELEKKTPDGILRPYIVETLMEKYAEYYARKCLEIAAKNALIKKEFTLGFDPVIYLTNETEENNYLMTVSKDSIINITLPEHE